jgi:cytochrome P450
MDLFSMLQAASTRDQSSLGQTYVPPAPRPQAHPLGPIALLRTLKRNPLECWATRHFEQPIVSGGLPIAHVLLVHEPRSIRRVLLDNASNYRKDRFQRRVLSAGLSDGLLSAEDEEWRIQRKVLAPMFARRQVLDFGPAMAGGAEDLVKRWASLGDAATIEVVAEMARVTLDVLERTIFSDGFGSHAEDIRIAMAVYFNTIGKISPLDILGAPDFVPRLSRIKIGRTLNFFESEVDRVISARRRILAEQPDRAPNDLLTHLLQAFDSQTEAFTEAELRSNILTFIAAGHETTANTLSWPFPGKSALQDRSLRLSSVRGRASEMHRIDVCLAGGDVCAGGNRKKLRLRALPEPQGVADPSRDVTACERLADADPKADYLRV